MYSQILSLYNVSERYSNLENKEMVSGAQYSIVQDDPSNAEHPIFIERFHEDEYIYIYPNFAKDGLIFRDAAMKNEYEGYIQHLIMSGKEDEISETNLDNFCIDISSMNVYPGVYIFVYDDSVPNHMRTLSVSLTEDPMGYAGYSTNLMSEELERLGVTFLVKSMNPQGETGIGSVLQKEGVSGDRLIVNGDNLNLLFDTLGMHAASIVSLEKAMIFAADELETAKQDLQSAYDQQVVALNQELTNLQSDVSNYNNQINSLSKQISDMIEDYPYVLQPAGPFFTAEQTRKRSQYLTLLNQRTSLTSLRSSAQSSIQSLQSQIANLSSSLDNAKIQLQNAGDFAINIGNAQIDIVKSQSIIPVSFRFVVPMGCRNSGVSRVCIYDHFKDIGSVEEGSFGEGIRSNISKYRKTLQVNDLGIFYGSEDNLLATTFWTMNYASTDLSSDNDIVSYYSISPSTGLRTSLTRSEYVTAINEVSLVQEGASRRLSNTFEIIITPPEASSLSSGQPSYNFGSVHSTTNLTYLKERIDTSKIYANPSIAFDFGEASGEERDASSSSASVQQNIQGSYRGISCFKLKKEGVKSKYSFSWSDSHTKNLNLVREYSSEYNAPKLVRDSLCGEFNAIQFCHDSLSLDSASFIPDYSFPNGFSIFMVVKQNEEFSYEPTNINALYTTGDIYKNNFIEIGWPSDLTDTDNIDSFETSFALNNIYFNSGILRSNNEQEFLEIYDVKGIDRTANHAVSTELSAYSSGKNPSAGFSNANFFEPDAYSIVNIDYNSGQTFKWYKNGSLKNTSESIRNYYVDAKTSSLMLGGHRTTKEYSEMVSNRMELETKLYRIIYLKNTYDKQKQDLQNRIQEAQSNEDNALVSTLTSSLQSLKISAEKSLSSFKNSLFDTVSKNVNRGFSGEVTEIVIYSNSINQDLRLKTEGYLAHKYCLDDLLPSDHIYKDTPPSIEEEDEQDDVGTPKVAVNYDLTSAYVYTTDTDGDGTWKTNWLPLSTITSNNSIYVEKASWDRNNNVLTLHRSGSADLSVDIDIFDTFVSEIFPINGELVPQFSSYIDSIFAYPTSSSSEQFSLAPAQAGFYDVVTFHSRSFPDLLWEENAEGDIEVGGQYNNDEVLDTSIFSKNADTRRRSSYIWSGLINKVGGSTASIRASKKFYTDSFSTVASSTPSASPIMIESSMDFNNGFRDTFLKTLNMDCMFTVARDWSDADFNANIDNFDAVGVRLITGNGSIYNLAFMIGGSESEASKFGTLINTDFPGAKIIQGFNQLETKYISIDISNANNQYIEIEAEEQYSLEFIVYLGKDGTAKLGATTRPIQSGWFVSNVSFVASDTQS